MRTRVKICGLTRLEDIRAAVSVGADALGLVFVSGSKRALTLERGHELAASIPAFVQSVALLKDPDPAVVEQVINLVKPDLLQFHGDESGAFCRQFHYPYIKAVSAMLDQNQLAAKIDEHPDARGFLLDSHLPGGLGGTGHAFDWSRWPGAVARNGAPFILAGGLNPDNVRTGIAQLHPYAVDVSSGVESVAGQKSLDKMQQFMRRVHND